jgi:hypothetical protein
MRPTDTYDHFESTFEYPIDRDDVIDATGETYIPAPTGDSESIADVLGRSEQSTYDSPQALYETFLACLGEQYIGRKFYDDRGSNFGIGGGGAI